ncbi:hypothetical protein [Bacillus pseudomycoides]|uniref:Cxxc_20_cxxc protein n=1 Tax=Bacillus pseudomycoides TaxID=64104 RepID=A0A2C3ZXM9_9BACI|nr:hypothetical protein [Bacillus pseudomycoides]PDY48517.1 hypothetical protein CON79_04050 [Bacillus pseudomycoides]PEA83001.1 hypothetical protein CON99_14100 [Bacillus pseudomycoides]PED10224.1 hypothetical protein COO19_00240 [Bacillus pseudomycoides]PED70706.1 hypothetical protein CON97_18160 [Bacillus pseudomycoides]PEI41203.1 hypothetical protein CN620_13070 [Bacillus pseudomycoides]
MKETIACPQCTGDITTEDMIEIPHPFTIRCPHCKVKVKETKVMPSLIGVGILIIPLFIFIGTIIKELLVNYFSIVEHVPTVLIFFLFCYSLYYLYEKHNAV